MKFVIVGGGVVGTMHAWFAVDQGHQVVHVERDLEPRAASVRNFGLIWVSGRRDGEELALARRSRELWAELGKRVPSTGYRADGSLTIALDGNELLAMKTYAATPGAEARDIEFVGPEEVREINPAIRGAVSGGLFCSSDAIVEPRWLLPALRSAMAETGRYTFEPGRHVVAVEPGRIADHTGLATHGDVVVLCPGAVYDGVGAEHFASSGLRRCRLQMLETEPLPDDLTTSIADADSLRYYPAYEKIDLDALGDQPPLAAENRMQLLMVQRPDGALTIGDTHEYNEPFDFAVDERQYTHLIERASRILGRPAPPIRRRWSGVYSLIDASKAGEEVVHRRQIDNGVYVVTGMGGRGMTLSAVVAEETIEELS